MIVLACDMYMYGDQCEQDCGWCYQDISCHHVTGLCENEICMEGYIAPYCQDGKNSFFSSVPTFYK